VFDAAMDAVISNEFTSEFTAMSGGSIAANTA
jgi:hypothetical protein